MNVLDIFSGIGAVSLGLQRAGMQTVAFCEISPFCRRVIARRWPGVPVFEDVRSLTGSGLAAAGIIPSVICGGFPCQNVSAAAAVHGGHFGLEGDQSGLWREYARLIAEIRPEVAIIENVDRLAGDGLDHVLRSLAGIRYDAQWDTIPGWLFGAPQARKRLWVVAYPSGKRMEGLFESIRSRALGQGGARRSANLFDVARSPFGGDDRFPQPLLRGMDDRLTDWMDRLRACGNAVIPDIPEAIGRTILDRFFVNEAADR